MTVETISQTHNSITEHLINLTKVANQNLQLLNTLNASLFSNATSLEVNYNDSLFYVPSFISMETRVAELEENIKKIVEVPKNGTTGIIYPKDGSMQRIVTLGFDNSPNKVSNISQPETFNVEPNYFFKDFITPNVYISFDLTNKIDNNIKQISVKKIILNESLFNNLYPLTTDEINERNLLLDLQTKQIKLTSEQEIRLNNLNTKLNSITYGDIKSKLYLLTENVDYKEFDKTYLLPYKNKNGYGDFKIVNVNTELINVKTSRNITATIKLDTLNYFINNGAITRKLIINDYLITADDKAIWQITNINNNTNEVTLELKQGYTTLRETIDDTNYYLKYYEENDFNNILKISLEEDKYILVFIAPINSELNLLAPWSNALFIDVDKLTNGQLDFREYYNTNVKNLGDILQGLMNEICPSLYMVSNDTFNKIINIEPNINTDNLKVIAINEHLNDSTNISDLKRLHIQKNELKNQLSVIQNDLDDIQNILASTSFDNTTELNRQGYENKYSSLLSQKRLTTQEMIKIINEISIKASENVIPLGKTKYRIRGYISNDPLNIFKDKTLPTYDSNFSNIDIIKWHTEYRYKNAISDNTKASAIGENNFIYTSWNIMDAPMRKKVGTWNNNIKEYEYKYENAELSNDSPSYVQVDIPIQQGEDVEIRTTAVLNIGYPYVTLETGFSPIVTITFPEELKVNVDVIEIIEQNNEDAQNAQFMNILINDGYREHIDDRIIDQDKTYFHKPEHIASGYYTSERRIIPLKDKISDIVNQVNTLEKTVLGNQNNIINVNISDGNIKQTVLPNTPLEFYVESYTKATNNYPNLEAPVISQKLYFNITNPTNAAINIYSLLPGANNMPLGEIANNQLGYNSNLLKNYQLFPIMIGDKWRTQNLGQFLYFRTINPFTSNSYFIDETYINALNTFVYNINDISKLIQTTDSNNKVLTWANSEISESRNVNITNLIPSTYTQLNYSFTNNHPIINIYAGEENDTWPILGNKNLSILYSQSKYINSNNIQWYNTAEYNKESGIFNNFKGSFNLESDIYTKGINSLGAYLYPNIMDSSILSVGSGIENASRTIQPNETISIPIYFEYRLADGSLTDTNTQSIEKIEKTIAFDIRTSLFKEPEIYIAKIIATLNPTTNEEQLRNSATNSNIQKYVTAIVT